VVSRAIVEFFHYQEGSHASRAFQFPCDMAPLTRRSFLSAFADVLPLLVPRSALRARGHPALWDSVQTQQLEFPK
jgi:hypothetical protein